MKCLKCGKAGCRYDQRRPKPTPGKRVTFIRTNFNAKCKYCGWEGKA